MSSNQVRKAPTQPNLPPDWALYYDSKNRPFYWNEKTKQSSWTAPTFQSFGPPAPQRGVQPQPNQYNYSQFQPTFTDSRTSAQYPSQNPYGGRFPTNVSSYPASASSASATSSSIMGNKGNEPLPHGWTQATDPQGRVYFINHLTRTTSWNDPRKAAMVTQLSSGQGQGQQGQGQGQQGQGQGPQPQPQTHPSSHSTSPPSVSHIPSTSPPSSQPIPTNPQQQQYPRGNQQYPQQFGQNFTNGPLQQFPSGPSSAPQFQPAFANDRQFSQPVFHSQDPRLSGPLPSSQDPRLAANFGAQSTGHFRGATPQGTGRFGPENTGNYGLQHTANYGGSGQGGSQNYENRGRTSSLGAMPNQLCTSHPKHDLQSQDEKACQICNSEFTFFKRRHHCRCCFRELCGNCTGKVSPVPQFGFREPVRVCDCCYGHLQRNQLACMGKLVEYLQPNNDKLGQALQELVMILATSPSSNNQNNAANSTNNNFTDLIVLGIFSQLISLLGSDHLTGDIATSLVELIAIMTSNSEINSTLAELGVIESLLSLQKSPQFQLTSTMRTHILGTILHQVDIPAGVPKLQEAGGLQFLIETLGGSTDPKQLDLGSLVLHKLVTQSPDLMARPICETGIPVILILLSSPIPHVVELNAQVLAALANTPENRTTIYSTGALSALFTLLKTPMANQNPSIQIAALSVVQLLAKEGLQDCQTIIKVEGSLDYLRDMFSPRTDHRVFEMVLDIVNCLMSHSSLQKSVLETIGTSSNGLIDLIATFDKEPTLQGQVLRLAGAVLQADPEAKVRFVKMDLIPKLLFVISKKNINQIFALQTLEDLLKFNVSNSITFIERGGPPVMVELLQASDQQVVKLAANILGDLLRTNQKAFDAINPKVVLQNVQALLKHQSQPIKEGAISIIVSYCRYPNTISMLIPNPNDQRATKETLAFIPVLLDNSLETIQASTLEILASITNHIDSSTMMETLAELQVLPSVISFIAQPNPALQRPASFTLCQMSRSPAVRKMIAEFGGLDAVTHLMALMNNDPEVCTWIAKTNATFSGDANARVGMKQAGAIKLAIGLLVSNFAPVQLNATTIIANFGTDESLDVSEIHELGGISTLISMLDTQDEVVQGASLWCLGHLAKNKFKQNILQGDCLSPLLNILGKASNPDTLAQAASTFSILSFDPSVAVFMENHSEAWGSFISMFNSPNPELKKHGVVIISNLCFKNNNNWHALVNIAGLPIVLGLLSTESLEAQNKSLDYLVQNSRDTRLSNNLIQQGGLKTLLDLLSRTQNATTTTYILQLLQALSQFGEAKQVLFSALPIFLTFLNLNKSKPDVATAVVILEAICQSPEQLQAAFVDSGAIQNVLRLLDSIDSATTLRILQMLAKVTASSPNNVKVLHQQNGIPALVALLSKKDWQQENANKEQEDQQLRAVVGTLANCVSVSEEAKNTLVEGEAASPIVLLLDSLDAEVAAQALYLASLLATSPKFCTGIAGLGATPKLVSLLDSAQPRDVTQILALLNNYARLSPAGRKEIVDAGGLNKLISLLEMKDETPEQAHEAYKVEQQRKLSEKPVLALTEVSQPQHGNLSSQIQQNGAIVPSTNTNHEAGLEHHSNLQQTQPERNLDAPLVTLGNTTITWRNLGTVQPGQWLDDQILNFLYDWFELREYPNKSICFVGPSVSFAWRMNEMDSETFSSVYLKPLDLGSREIVFMVLNDNTNAEKGFGGSHWSLLVWRKATAKFEHYDSSAHANFGIAIQTIQRIAPYLESDQAEPIAKECPRQQNSADCGVWAFFFTQILADQFLNRTDSTFEQLATQELFAGKRRQIFQIIQRVIGEERGLSFAQPQPQIQDVTSDQSVQSEASNNNDPYQMQLETGSLGIRVLDEYEDPDNLESAFQHPSANSNHDPNYDDTILSGEGLDQRVNNSNNNTNNNNNNISVNHNNNYQPDFQMLKAPQNVKPLEEQTPNQASPTTLMVFHQSEHRTTILEIIANLSQLDIARKQLGQVGNIVALLEGLIDVPDQVLPQVSLRILTNMAMLDSNRRLLSEEYFHAYLLQTAVQMISNKQHGLVALRLIDMLSHYPQNPERFAHLDLVTSLIELLKSAPNDFQTSSLYLLRNLSLYDPKGQTFAKSGGIAALRALAEEKDQVLMPEILRILCFLALFEEHRPELQENFDQSFFQTPQVSPFVQQQAQRLNELLF